jgi:Ca2+:H+ antiporter
MNNASVGLNHLQTTAQTGTSYDRTPEFGSLNGSPRVNITSSAQVASHDRQKIEFKAGVFWLSILVAATAIASINFVNAIEGTAETLMISDTFISGILLPLPSGAVEASASIVFAAKNKLNSSLEICLGSSCQIAALILPLFVLIGWVFDRRMTYRFEGFEGITYFVTLMMTVLIIKDGKSTMLLGLLLMIAYFIVGVAYFVHKSDLEM